MLEQRKLFIPITTQTPTGTVQSGSHCVVTEEDALELLDRVMALLRVPSWIQSLVRHLAKGFAPDPKTTN